MAEESVQSTADVVTRSTASVYQSAAPTQASSYLEGIVAEQLYQVTTLPRTPLLFHPAIVILIVAVGSQALKVFGHENVVALLSPLHTIVFHYKTAKTQTQLKRDLFTTRQQLNQTSSQDEFAKWAKLRRKVDKDLADLEAVNKTLASSRATLRLFIRGALFLATTVLPLCVTNYFRKTPIFWLPPTPVASAGFRGWKGGGTAGEWLGPLGWVLSLPSAPRGAVSATVWNMVCGRIVAMAVALLKDIYSLVFVPSAHLSGKRLHLVQPSAALQSIWYGVGLASCSFAFFQFQELEKLTGVDLSSQFGGHYQFLTNISLVLTSVTLLLGITRAVSSSLPLVRELKSLASTITMPIEVMVSLLYWTFLAIDPALLIPSRKVPDTLNPGQFVMETVRLPLLIDLCMHAFPAILLLVDFLVFSPPLPLRCPSVLTSWPIWTSVLSTMSYCLWAEVCNAHNGHYPYPLLSMLSTPHRVALYIACGLTMGVVLVASNALHCILDQALSRTWNPKVAATGTKTAAAAAAAAPELKSDGAPAATPAGAQSGTVAQRKDEL